MLLSTILSGYALETSCEAKFIRYCTSEKAYLLVIMKWLSQEKIPYFTTFLLKWVYISSYFTWEIFVYKVWWTIFAKGNPLLTLVVPNLSTVRQQSPGKWNSLPHTAQVTIDCSVRWSSWFARCNRKVGITSLCLNS